MDNILNNIFSTHDFFLFEVFAIPEDIRKEYLNKLIVRKGGSKQKNVRFLRYIYKVLEQNKIRMWDENLICKELGISARMLDCYKSRILKSLREHYFDRENQVDILRNEEYEDETELEMAMARKMSRIGMIKEAKQIYLKIENALEKGEIKRDREKYHILLSEIYEELGLYYYFQRDQRKFSLYLSRAEANLKKARNVLSSKEIKPLEISLLKTLFRKQTFKSISEKNITASIGILKKILDLCDKKSYETRLYAYENIGIMSGKLKDFKSEEKYLREGLKLAEEKGFSENAMVFDLLLTFTEFREDNKIAKSFYKKTEKYYNLIKNNYSDFGNLLTILRNHIRMMIYFNKDGSDELVEDFIKYLLLFSQKTDAVSNWYLELSDRLSSGLYRWEVAQNGPDDFAPDITVDKKLHKYFEEMNYKTLIHFRGLYSPEALAVVYLNQIDLEFWKGSKCNYENANYFIGKLQRLIKTRHLGTNPMWLISNKIGINIFEEMHIRSKKDVFDRRFPEIKELIETLKDEKQIFNIVDDFAKLIFISKILNTPRMKLEVKNLEAWIKKNQPDLFKAILSIAVMKNRETQVA